MEFNRIRFLADVSRRATEALLCISTVLLIGVGLGVFGWRSARTDVRLDRQNAVIEGKVIKGFTTTGMRGGIWSHLVVEYQPANHPSITREFDVDGATYKASLDTRKASVTYLPEDPRISRVTRFAPLPYQIVMWLGVCMALAGIIGLASFIKSRPRR